MAIIGNLIYLIGIATIAYFFVQLTSFVIFYNRTSSLARYKHGPGEPWALVTGGGGGIGFGYAQRLCEAGFNVIILGHLPDELAAAKKQLEQRYPQSKIRIILTNAIFREETASLETTLTALVEREKLNITVLINNVGGLPPMNDYLKFLTDYSLSQIDDTAHLNAVFHAKMARIMIPILARTGKPALIINTSSVAVVGIAYQALYGASKAFMVSLTHALASEMASRALPIEVLCVVPHAVQSTGLAVPTAWNTPSSYHFARCVLDKVGGGRRVFRAYYVHQLENVLMGFLPERVLQRETTKMIENTFATMGLRRKE